jgi:hypothetical protein
VSRFNFAGAWCLLFGAISLQVNFSSIFCDSSQKKIACKDIQKKFNLVFNLAMLLGFAGFHVLSKMLFS